MSGFLRKAFVLVDWSFVCVHRTKWTRLTLLRKTNTRCGIAVYCVWSRVSVHSCKIASSHVLVYASVWTPTRHLLVSMPRVKTYSSVDVDKHMFWYPSSSYLRSIHMFFQRHVSLSYANVCVTFFWQHGFPRKKLDINEPVYTNQVKQHVFTASITSLSLYSNTNLKHPYGIISRVFCQGRVDR